MPTLTRDGQPVFWEVFDGPSDTAPLLLIPGLTASTRTFPTVVASATRRHRVIALDPRGGGHTPARGPFTLADVADDAAAVLDAAGAPTAHVLGISMGGMIAQEFALRHPSRVASLVLSCTASGNTPGVLPRYATAMSMISRMARSRRARGPEDIARAFGDLLFADDAPLDVQADFFRIRAGARPTFPGMIAQMLAVRRFEAYDRLPRWQGDTMIITGTADRLVPAVNSDILARALPHAHNERLPGGHVYFYEHPTLFEDALLTFLAR